MSKTKKLKVFRTAIGFHDAYVAAPSQKAALEAWGSSRNLFASGAAEVVTDERLIVAPLAEPGIVLKVSRGSRAEQIAALGKPNAVQRSAPRSVPKIESIKPRRGARPSRATLDVAEAALVEMETGQKKDLSAVEREEVALQRKRRKLEKKHEREMAHLADKRDRAQSAFDRSLAKWKLGDS